MSLKNPFLVYIAAFAAVLLTYQLGWSEVYPPLSSGLVLFFLATFFCAAILALAIAPVVNQIGTYESGRLWKYTGAALTLSFVADFMASGFVPFISLLSGEHIDFDAIGIPSLHVFNVTFEGIIRDDPVCRFPVFQAQNLSARSLYPARVLSSIGLSSARAHVRRVLGVCLSDPAWRLDSVTVSRCARAIRRGEPVSKWHHRRREIAIAICSCRITGRRLGQTYRGVSAVRNSKDLFWSYVYFTSPMANVQTTFNVAFPVTGKGTTFVLGEMLPDALTHRVLDFLGEERIRTPEISPGLNASTIFGASYVYLGQFGPPLMFAYLSLIIIVYLLLTRRTAFNVPSLALLNTIVVFCTFHNMIASSIMSLQLVWTVVFGVLVSRSPARTRAVSN